MLCPIRRHLFLTVLGPTKFKVKVLNDLVSSETLLGTDNCDLFSFLRQGFVVQPKSASNFGNLLPQSPCAGITDLSHHAHSSSSWLEWWNAGLASMKSWVSFPAPHNLGMAIHLYFSAQEKVGIGGWKAQGHSWMFNKFEASLLYRRPCFHGQAGRMNGERVLEKGEKGESGGGRRETDPCPAPGSQDFI